jgi:iron complex outermembrane recepter protein
VSSRKLITGRRPPAGSHLGAEARPALYRILSVCAGLCVLATSLAGPPASPSLTVDIPPQALDQALEAFAEQTGLQLFYVSDIVSSRKSPGARSGLVPSEALGALLEGTGLEFEFVNNRAVRIFPGPDPVPTHSASLSSAAHSAVRRGDPRPVGLEEVIVTGTRGQEPLSRVPIDMVVWTDEAMEVSGVKGMTQIGALTPGVDFAFSPGVGSDAYTHVDIRGVTNRGGATVGVYLDDVPIPPTRAATYTLSWPATFDLDRVEILRGPQTVLLGDHAQSGAIRFLPNQPSLTDSTGHVRAEWGVTEYGDPSYEAGAAVGGPIVTDLLGFRVSGWFRQDGGYVDRTDPVRGVTLEPNANRYVTKAVRAALTFAPTPSLELTPSLVYESIRIDDPSTFDSTLSDPERGIFRGPSNLPQPAEDEYYLASIKLAAHLGAADLSAFASYFNQSFTTEVNGLSVAGVNDSFVTKQRAYSGEVRLSSRDPDASLGWVAGVFASSEHTHNPSRRAGSPDDDLVVDRSQLAAFGEIALKVTTRFTANAGVRIGHSDYEAVSEVPPQFHAAASDSWSAPRFGLSWQADEYNLIYFTIAKGYGSGGVYPLNPVAYLPDTLWSYEVGSKHELLDRRLRLEAGLFHIAWNNALATSDLDTLLNQEHFNIPGSAVSNGFDLATKALITEHTRAALEVAYTNAHFTRTVTIDGQLLVREGEFLPISPWNAVASLEQEFPLRGNVTSSVRLEDAFRSGSRPSYATDPASAWYTLPHTDPSANILNVRVAVKWSNFEVAAFLRNALNAHPLMYGLANGVDNGWTSTSVFTLVPRTFSVSTTWRY